MRQSKYIFNTQPTKHLSDDMDATKMSGFFGARDYVKFDGVRLPLGEIFGQLRPIEVMGKNSAARCLDMQVGTVDKFGAKFDWVSIRVEAQDNQWQTVWGQLYYFHLNTLRLIRRIEYSAGETCASLESLIDSNAKAFALMAEFARLQVVNQLTAEGMMKTCYFPCSPSDSNYCINQTETAK